MNRSRSAAHGYTLLPVILLTTTMALVAMSINRDSGQQVARYRYQADYDRARYIAEAGLQAVNSIVQTKKCAGNPVVASPIPTGNFGGGTFTGYASAGSGSPLTLTATGTYKGVSVTLQRPNTISFQDAIKNYTIQLGTASSTGTDTFISSIFSNTNNGSDDLGALYGTRHFLFLFNLAIFPAGSLAETATLQLRRENTSVTTVFTSRRMNASWVEGTSVSPANGATWNTSDGTSAWAAGGDYHSTVLSSGSVTGNNWVSIDATQAAIGWMTGRYPNYGLRISNDSGLWGTDGDVFMRENTSGSKRPKLVFTYWLPCNATAP